MAQWRDAEATLHPTCGEDPRIVSLVPSITELLCALGLGPNLVGRTGFCVHPREQVRSIPKLGGTKDPAIEQIRALAPTHVVLNIDENRREDAMTLKRFVPHVVVTHPNAPADNLELYALLGGIFRREAEAATLATSFSAALASAQADGSGNEERVLYLIWRDPWMTVSRETYISRTLALFGWHTQPAAAVQRYPSISLEDYRGEIDRVLLSSEPYPFRERHLEEVRQALPGVPAALIDGEMTSWYGNRAIEGLAYLRDYTGVAMRGSRKQAMT